MHRRDPISATHQMYLKTLYKLCQTHPVGRVRDLADELGVTPGTVSTALTKLQKLGLIEREHYGGALLTPVGEAIGECIERRFEILKSLLVDAFGVDQEAAEADACMMEHAVSPMTLNRISMFLDLLHSGQSFDLESLRQAYDEGKGMCPTCEATGTCQAVDSTVEH